MSWGALGPSKGPLEGLGRLLGSSWGALGRLLGALGPSKELLEGLGRLLGGSWGALGGLLGGSWELFGASRSTKEGLQIRLGTLLGLVCSLLAAEDGFGKVLGPYLARFWRSR